VIRFLNPSFAVLLSALAAGCAGGGARDAALHLQPLTPGRPDYVQRFGQVYATPNAAGGNDVLLVDRSHPAVEQYLHVKVLWRPMSGMKADQPSATNAAIDWYVVSRDPDRPGVLRYAGAGFVLAQPANDERLRVEVRNASVKLERRDGDVYDPIGPAKLDGTFTATLDAGRVSTVLAELDAALAGPRTAQVDR